MVQDRAIFTMADHNHHNSVLLM